MLSGFLNFSTKRKIPIYVTRDKGLILMNLTVTIRLSLARPCDETSTMLSIALCFFFFNSWATTVQSLIHPQLIWLPNISSFLQLTRPKMSSFTGMQTLQKRKFSSLLRRRRRDGWDLASPAVKNNAKWKEQVW